MALASGTRLGPYEILSPIGAGGMGEVYRARDTRLGREVAVKVLPEHLSASPEVRQRFEREARAVSSLNHPHICTLHDVGRQGEIDFIVMELLEGESLAVRLKRGPLPPPEALRIGIQIADALEKAHRAGIVHRDLKPGNIVITRGGAKLLDFGLARSMAAGPRPPAGGSGVDALSTTPTVSRPLTAAPTVEGPLTSQGTILGTYQYMAPEQIEGLEADQRTDIFAFGLVLYEMLTGRRAFEASTQASLIAEILKGEPRRITDLAGVNPASLDRLVRICIRKDPDDRFQSAHDLRLQLEWIDEAGAADAGAVAAPAPKRRRFWPPAWLVAGIAVLVAMVGWSEYNETRRKLDDATRPIALSISMPTGMKVESSDFSMSPDGRMIAFVAEDSEGMDRLWIREFSRLEARMVPGTEDAAMPFWSPDGLNLGFFSQGKVKRVAIDGGPVQVLCDWRGGHGGTWSEQGVILFGGEPAGGLIMKVPAGGGIAEPITSLEAPEGSTGFVERARHEWPHFLPGGRRFLFLQFSGRTTERSILVGDLEGGKPIKLLQTEFKTEFMEPDWLVFVDRSSLMAQRFDLDSLQMRGEASAVVDGVAQAAFPGEASYSASRAGHIAFRRRPAMTRTQLTWYSRDGGIEGTASDEGAFVSVSLAPDGRTVSTSKATGGDWSGTGVGEAPVDLWNFDLMRGVSSRFTSRQASSDENPVWSPDGKQIAFASHKDGVAAVYVRDSSAAGDETLLYASADNPHPISWSPDGRYLLLQVEDVIGDIDLAVLDLTRSDAEPAEWLTSPENQAQGQFSPDGKQIAYASDESGDHEVFVRPFPTGDGRWQISGGGGEQPRWRDDGSELYYIAPDGRIMAVKIETGHGFQASAPVPLFKPEVLTKSFNFYGAQAAYDVARGGQRFLVNRNLEKPDAGATIDVILNWPRHAGAGE